MLTIWLGRLAFLFLFAITRLGGHLGLASILSSSFSYYRSILSALFTLLFPVGYRPATGRPSQAGRASARGRKGKVLLCFASLVVVPIGRPSFCRRPNQQRASLRNWAGPGCALPQPIAIGCPPSLHAQTINSFKHPSISAILPNTSSTTTSTHSTQDDKPQPPQPPCRLHVSNCAQPCR